MTNEVSIQQIKEVIGEENLQKLVDHFPGKLIYIPKKGIQFPDQASRNNYIRDQYFSGMDIEFIAEQVGLSKDRTRKIANKR